jgi:hypothetical protein
MAFNCTRAASGVPVGFWERSHSIKAHACFVSENMAKDPERKSSQPAMCMIGNKFKEVFVK